MRRLRERERTTTDAAILDPIGSSSRHSSAAKRRAPPLSSVTALHITQGRRSKKWLSLAVLPIVGETAGSEDDISLQMQKDQSRSPPLIHEKVARRHVTQTATATATGGAAATACSEAAPKAAVRSRHRHRRSSEYIAPLLPSDPSLSGSALFYYGVLRSSGLRRVADSNRQRTRTNTIPRAKSSRRVAMQ